MSGQTLLNLAVLLGLVVWAAELYWLYRRAADEGDDPFSIVSGAAIFFVLAAPVAIRVPDLVDQISVFWERLVSLDLFRSNSQSTPRLIVAGRSVPLAQSQTRIGRYPNNDVVLDHPTVSAYHAEISRRADGRHELNDRESRNGTRINGTPIRSAVLRDGDQITLGAITLHYLIREVPDRLARPGRVGGPARR